MKYLEQIENEILNNGEVNDIEYFQFHKYRFKRFDEFLALNFDDAADPKSPKVLEIGSHYLHSSMILSKRNFDVDAMDVSEFWNLDFVKKRANKFGLNPIVENNLATLTQFQGVKDKYDLIVFTEILEHITFNPILFWKTIYNMIKPGGIIYISTPNSLALPNYFRNLKNLLLFKSIGISVDDVFSKVTYGHHWKEYSAKEIKSYFESLSDDFEIKINPYHYKTYELKSPFLLFKILSKIGNTTKFFADDLEVIVRVPTKNSWKREAIDY